MKKYSVLILYLVFEIPVIVLLIITNTIASLARSQTLGDFVSTILIGSVVAGLFGVFSSAIMIDSQKRQSPMKSSSFIAANSVGLLVALTAAYFGEMISNIDTGARSPYFPHAMIILLIYWSIPIIIYNFSSKLKSPY